MYLGTGSVKALLDGNGRNPGESSPPLSGGIPPPRLSGVGPGSPGDRPVAAIGPSGRMHGVVLCDAASRPLRPAILIEWYWV